MTITNSFKGSKRCMLEFISDTNFIENINSLISDSSAVVDTNDNWFPKGLNNDKEAELKDFLKTEFDTDLGQEVKEWWLTVSSPKASTPNWDMMSTCKINNKKGLLLVEAKAHCFELENESKGKPLALDASDNSIHNHERIGNAINEAKEFINKFNPEISISREKCYQLSNRVAHAWWLANHGIPVVLLYLGFLKANDMHNGKNIIFDTENDWITCFLNHSKQVGVDKIIDKWINSGNESFKLIVKSY